MVDCGDRVKLMYRAAKLIKSEITDCRGISIRPPIMLWMSSSFVYHRLILSTLCVGAMLWSMAQLRRGQLRMVVYVVGSCWWCGQLSVLARHTHMPHYPPVPTSSWMLCTDRPQFAIYLRSSSVFGTDLLPWRLLQGSIRGGVLGWVRMLPTPASTLPQSMHPSTGPQRWHLLSLLVVGFTGLESAWGHFVLCRVVQDVPVVFHCFPCQGEGGCFPPLAGRGYPC